MTQRDGLAASLILAAVFVLSRRGSLHQRFDLKHDAIQLRRRIPQVQYLFAKVFISYLLGGARYFFAFGVNLDGWILDHVLAPVLAFDPAGSYVKVSVEMKQAQLYRSWLAGFAPDGGQVSDHIRAVFQVHGPQYTFPIG